MMGGAAGIIGFPGKPLDPSLPRDRVTAAIGMIVEVRLTADLGISIEELYERSEDGQYLYGDEFETTFSDVRQALDDLFND